MKLLKSINLYITLTSAFVHSWTVNLFSRNVQNDCNRAILLKVCTATALGTTLLLSPFHVPSANAVDFTGSYSDPQHPSCPRLIVMDGTKAIITGVDGNPGCSDGIGTSWKLVGRVDEKMGGNAQEIYVDFSPKGGPKDLMGKWEINGIKWPDGNKWTFEGRP